MTSMPDLTIALSIIFIMEQNRHCAIMAIIKISLKEAYFYMSSPGVYTFDDIKIVCQPMDNYIKKYVKKLKLNIKNLEIEHNKISYNAKLNNKKLICTAVPYSKGWSAKLMESRQK